MSYNTIAAAAQDSDLRLRVAACFAQETTGTDQPEALAALHMWRIAASPGWGDAYASAQAAGNPRPGADPAVITDPQILAAVQHAITPTPAPDPNTP